MGPPDRDAVHDETIADGEKDGEEKRAHAGEYGAWGAFGEGGTGAPFGRHCVRETDSMPSSGRVRDDRMEVRQQSCDGPCMTASHATLPWAMDADGPDVLIALRVARFAQAPVLRWRRKAAMTKVSTTLRLDPEVWATFTAEGPGWQSRINAALRWAVGL